MLRCPLIPITTVRSVTATPGALCATAPALAADLGRRQFRSSLLVFAALFALAFLAPVTAEAATLPVKGDAHIGDQSSNANYGASADVNVDGNAPYSGLIQFDLSTLPTGTASSDVAKATLYLFVNNVASAGSFNVNEASGLWTEDTVTGRTAPAT